MYILIIIILLVIIIIDKKKAKTDTKGTDNQVKSTEIDSNYIPHTYTPKWMFSMNEKQAFYKLKEIADKHNLIVFAKVRLLDLVSPINGHPKYKTNLYRIQAKHVDFVLCKNNLVAKYVIELDDNSHDTQKGKARDQFVDNVLRDCGYKVLHTRSITEEEIEKLIRE